MTDSSSLDVDTDLPHVGAAAVPRTMAAGRVLFVMVVALVLGALLNADELVKSAESRSLDDPSRQRHIDTWEAVQTVSHALRLDVPRKVIDDWRGVDDDTGVDAFGELPTSEGTEDAEVDTPTDPVPDSGGESTTTSSTTTSTLPDRTPEVRVATAADPLRVWVGGDSMSQVFGESFQRVAATTGIMVSTLDARPSTGLTRPDFFNWPGHFTDEVLPADPEIVVVMFGANDSQGLQLPDGTVCQRFEQCWLDTYRSRVAFTMDLLEDPERERLVVWVGQPIMGPGSGVYGMDKLNFLYWDEARQRDWVLYFDSYPYFADPAGNYSHFLPSANGTEAEMRTQDEVHFTEVGGDRLAWEVMEEIDRHLDLSNGTVDPPPAVAAPDSVEGRETVPPAVAELIE